MSPGAQKNPFFGQKSGFWGSKMCQLFARWDPLFWQKKGCKKSGCSRVGLEPILAPFLTVSDVNIMPLPGPHMGFSRILPIFGFFRVFLVRGPKNRNFRKKSGGWQKILPAVGKKIGKKFFIDQKIFQSWKKKFRTPPEKIPKKIPKKKPQNWF